MEEKKKGFFSRLVEGLTKTRENIVSGMDSIFSGFSAIDDDFYEFYLLPVWTGKTFSIFIYRSFYFLKFTLYSIMLFSTFL